MRGLRRRVIYGLTVMSLLLCLGTIKLWLRSYGACDIFYLERVSHIAEGQDFLEWYLECDRGGVVIARHGFCYPPIQLDLHPNYWKADGWYTERYSRGSNGHYPYITDVNAPEAFRIAGFQLTTGLRPRQKDPNRWYTAALVVPLWAVTLLLAFAPAKSLVRWLRRRGQPPSNACPCLRCSYDLTGNVSGVCPECGTPILTTAI